LLNSKTLALISQRNAAKKIADKKEDAAFRVEYKRLRNEVIQECNIAKKQYF